jgi:hypothetical protein
MYFQQKGKKLGFAVSNIIAYSYDLTFPNISYL